MLEEWERKSSSGKETLKEGEEETGCKTREKWVQWSRLREQSYPSSEVSSPMSQLPAAHWISLSLWPTKLFLASHIHPGAQAQTNTHIYIGTLTHICIYAYTVIHKESGIPDSCRQKKKKNQAAYFRKQRKRPNKKESKNTQTEKKCRSVERHRPSSVCEGIYSERIYSGNPLRITRQL